MPDSHKTGSQLCLFGVVFANSTSQTTGSTTPIPWCGASSQTFTEHEPLPATAGSLQPPAWAWGTKDGTQLQRSQKCPSYQDRSTTWCLRWQHSLQQQSTAVIFQGWVPVHLIWGSRQAKKGEYACLDSKTAV